MRHTVITAQQLRRARNVLTGDASSQMQRSNVTLVVEAFQSRINKILQRLIKKVFKTILKTYQTCLDAKGKVKRKIQDNQSL